MTRRTKAEKDGRALLGCASLIVIGFIMAFGTCGSDPHDGAVRTTSIGSRVGEPIVAIPPPPETYDAGHLHKHHRGGGGEPHHYRSAPHCVRGCPCGNSCIPCNHRCRH